ncbi:MAG: hypothetical protein QNJ08_18825 [Crocosphaera sp.]|nr:hypothetical protein [Crocosphaera sp.]
MLSTDLQRESMIKRIKKVVFTLMEEDSLFREDLDYDQMVQDLANIFMRNLTFEQFMIISDDDLKKRCSGIMSIELLSKIGEDFTPEQMRIFDEAIKRK